MRSAYHGRHRSAHAANEIAAAVVARVLQYLPAMSKLVVTELANVTGGTPNAPANVDGKPYSGMSGHGPLTRTEHDRMLLLHPEAGNSGFFTDQQISDLKR